MASATFTLRAVDATKAAFAGVQNSLAKLEQSTKSIAKITKLAFGGEAVLGALNMMKQRLEKVAIAGDEMGFDRDQIASAIRMESAVEGVLNFFTKIPLALSALGFQIKGIFDPIDPAKTEATIAAFKFEKAKKEIESTVDQTAKLGAELERLGMSAGEIGDLKLAESMELFNKANEAFIASDPAKGFLLRKQGVEAYVDAQKTSLDLEKQIKVAQEELNKVLPESQRIGLSQKDLIAGLSSRYEVLTYQITAARSALMAKNEGDISSGFAQEDLLKKLKEQAAVTAQLNPLLEKQKELGRDAGQMIASSFEDAIFAGSKLSDTLRSLAQDLMRLFFRQAVTAPFAGITGDFVNKLLGRAGGGPVTAGTPYMVGEKGPELFVPGASGSIVPNNRMSGSSDGGGGVTVNYAIASGVSRAELVPILESERKRLKAEIPDMVRRGGAYRTAFA